MSKTGSSTAFQTIFRMVRLLALYFVLYLGLYYALAASKKLSAHPQYATMIALLFAGVITFLWLPKENKRFALKGKGGAAIGILLCSAGLAVLLNYLFTVIPWNEFLPETLKYKPSEGTLDMPLWTALIGYGVIAPFAEETCFRGVLFFSLRKTMKAPFAILISALLFALYHANFVQGLYAFIMGILIATVADRTDSLLGAVLFHMAANTIVTLYGYYQNLEDFLSSVPGLLICAAAALTGGILLAVFVSKGRKGEEKVAE